MFIVDNFLKLVTNAFGPICRKYSLSIKPINDDQVAVQGKDFLILACLDRRDGTSMQYVNFSDKGYMEVIDIMGFIAKKRTWEKDESIVCGEGFQSQVRCELLATAHALDVAAPDILSGEKKWLASIFDPPGRLSKADERMILEAIK